MQILTPTLRDFIAFEPLSGSRPRGWENVRARRAVCRFIRTILDLLALVEEGQRGGGEGETFRESFGRAPLDRIQLTY